MAVTFILGRAGAGKTRHCLDAILTELARAGQTRRLMLLVPEQASFQMERALAAETARGGYTRAEVLSFSRLAHRAFDQTGPAPQLLGERVRILALRCVAARAGSDARILRQATRTAGFHAQLDRLIEQLLREGVSPQELLAAATRLENAPAGRKVRELAQLYADYVSWLGPERVDPAARLAVLCARLAELTWLREASVWVDGFAGFTGQELQTLVELARHTRDMTITLLLDPAAPEVRNPRQTPDSLGLFYRTAGTYQTLHRLLAAAGVEVKPPLALPPAGLPRFAVAPALATLEAGLATPAGVPPEAPSPGLSGDDSVALAECATHREELRAAARWIRTRIVDSRGSLRFRDFALITRDLEPFADLIAEVFAEYEIPYFLDRLRPLRAHPLSRLLLAVLEVATSDFAVLPTARLLRARLLPLTRDEAETLENLVLCHRVAGAACWRRPTWELDPGGKPGDAFAPRRADIVAAFEPLQELVTDERGATGAAWAEALLAVLERLGVRAKLEAWIADAQTHRRWESAETHRQAWTTLCAVLDGLHDVLGATRLSPAELKDVLGSALGELKLGLAPPTVDQVLVTSVDRSRHPDVKHAWVFAFNEGLFPPRPADDLLLSTVEREALARTGLPAPAPHREDAYGERLLAYIALTRPSHSLTISYATVADDGGELMPSPLVAELTRALPGLAPVRVGQHEPPATIAELARGYLGARHDERRPQDQHRYERLCAQVRQMPAQVGKLEWLLRGVDYQNTPEPVRNYRRPAAADVAWDGSPSEVETYLQCPFKHFALYGLRLDPARGPRPLRWDLGDVAHAILADLTRRAMDEDGGVRGVSDERWRELLDAAAEDFRKGQPADYASRRPDLAFMGTLLAGFLRDVVATHAGRWRRGRFEPWLCEQPFRGDGAPGSLPGVEFRLASGQRVRLHGQIDRVDVCRRDDRTWLLVYDYKSGAIGPVRDDFLTGHRLQLLIYLLALRQSEVGDQPVRPAGVFLAPLYPHWKSLESKYVADAAELQQTMYLYRPRGLVDEAVAHLLDDQLGPTPSPVAHLQLKKDGTFYQNSDVAPANRLDQYLELARRTVLAAADGICSGCIDVAPLVENRTLACRLCDFQAVCRFDPAYNTPRAAEVALPRLGEPTPSEGGDA